MCNQIIYFTFEYLSYFNVTFIDDDKNNSSHDNDYYESYLLISVLLYYVNVG